MGATAVGGVGGGVGRMDGPTDSLTPMFSQKGSLLLRPPRARPSLFLCVSAIGILIAFSEGFASAAAPLSLFPSFPLSLSFLHFLQPRKEPFYDAIISAGRRRPRPLLLSPAPSVRPQPPPEKESFINERKKATAVTAISPPPLSLYLYLSLPLFGVIARARHYANIMNSHAPPPPFRSPLFVRSTNSIFGRTLFIAFSFIYDHMRRWAGGRRSVRTLS